MIVRTLAGAEHDVPWHVLQANRSTMVLDAPGSEETYFDEPRSYVALEFATLLSSGLHDEEHPLYHRPVLDIDDVEAVHWTGWERMRMLLTADDEGNARISYDDWFNNPLRACLVPSSTAGHAHLYSSTTINCRAYMEALMALGAEGLVEPGYALASIRRWATHVRLPWVTKKHALHQAPGEKIPEDPF